jgi:hypothetical protein
MPRGPLLVLPLVLVAPLVTGCALFDRSSSLDDALETMPHTVTRVTFVDDAGADRLDLELAPRLDDDPITDDDVEWEVTGYDGEDVGRVWKIDEDVDLEGLEDADPSFTVLPDAHLVVSGPLTRSVLSTVSDDTESLVDSGSFEDLADSTDDVEVADLTRQDAVCSLGDSRIPPEQLAATGLADLSRPDASGFFVHGDDGEVRAVMLFADGDAADEAADERETFLADGTSPVSGVPYSEFGSYEVETDGEQVRIEVEYDDPDDVSAVLRRRDYPSVCVP